MDVIIPKAKPSQPGRGLSKNVLAVGGRDARAGRSQGRVGGGSDGSIKSCLPQSSAGSGFGFLHARVRHGEARPDPQLSF